ncbi:hypothetical protein ACKWTF_001565 [Chironomus riparius]
MNRVEKNADTTVTSADSVNGKKNSVEASESEIRESFADLKVNDSSDQAHPVEYEPSTDPFKIFPQLIVDKIIKEFSADTILKASLVNKVWYEAIGHSKVCMEKIKLKIYKFSNSDVAKALKSKRDFQTIVFSCNPEHYVGFLKHFPNIKDLSISYDIENFDMELPNVKRLLVESQKIYKNGILSKLTKIPELEWIAKDCLDKGFVDIMIDYLRKNSDLKRLFIHDFNADNAVMEIIDEDYSKYKFKLDTFSYLLKAAILPHEEEVMINFLKSQAGSLTTVLYDSPVPDSILVSLLKDLPKLTFLGLNTMWLNAPKLPKIRPNPNIKICQIFKPMPLKMQYLMPLMPNLEHLYLDNIQKRMDNVHMMELIMTLAPKSLKTIGYITGNHAELNESFEKMN